MLGEEPDHSQWGYSDLGTSIKLLHCCKHHHWSVSCVEMRQVRYLKEMYVLYLV